MKPDEILFYYIIRGIGDRVHFSSKQAIFFSTWPASPGIPTIAVIKRNDR